MTHSHTHQVMCMIHAVQKHSSTLGRRLPACADPRLPRSLAAAKIRAHAAACARTRARGDTRDRRGRPAPDGALRAEPRGRRRRR